MSNIVDLTRKRILVEIGKSPTRGTIIVPRESDERIYKSKMKALSDFLKENNYSFGVRGDREETHVNYELRGRVQNA